MKSYTFNLIKIENAEHVIIDADSKEEAQNITTRLYIALMEKQIKSTPLGRYHLLVPGMTKEKLQEIVNDQFNPDTISVEQSNDISKL